MSKTTFTGYVPSLKAKHEATITNGKAIESKGGSIRYTIQGEYEGRKTFPKTVSKDDFEGVYGFNAKEALTILHADTVGSPEPADVQPPAPSEIPFPQEPTNASFSATTERVIITLGDDPEDDEDEEDEEIEEESDEDEEETEDEEEDEEESSSNENGEDDDSDEEKDEKVEDEDEEQEEEDSEDEDEDEEEFEAVSVEVEREKKEEEPEDEDEDGLLTPMNVALGLGAVALGVAVFGAEECTTDWECYTCERCKAHCDCGIDKMERRKSMSKVYGDGLESAEMCGDTLCKGAEDEPEPTFDDGITGQDGPSAEPTNADFSAEGVCVCGINCVCDCGCAESGVCNCGESCPCDCGCPSKSDPNYEEGGCEECGGDAYRYTHGDSTTYKHITYLNCIGDGKGEYYEWKKKDGCGWSVFEGESFETESLVEEPDWIPDGDGRALGQQNLDINLSPLHAEQNEYHTSNVFYAEGEDLQKMTSSEFVPFDQITSEIQQEWDETTAPIAADYEPLDEPTNANFSAEDDECSCNLNRDSLVWLDYRGSSGGDTVSTTLSDLTNALRHYEREGRLSPSYQIRHDGCEKHMDKGEIWNLPFMADTVGSPSPTFNEGITGQDGPSAEPTNSNFSAEGGLSKNAQYAIGLAALGVGIALWNGDWVSKMFDRFKR